MSDEAIEGRDARRRVFERVNRMIADGRLSLEEVLGELDARGAEVLSRTPVDDFDLPDALLEQFVKLAERGAQRARHERTRAGAAPPEAAIVHEVPALEVVTVRLLLIGVDPSAALEIFDHVEASVDTRVEIGRARTIEQAAPALAHGDFDVAVLDLSREDGPGLEVLAHADLGALSMPLLLLVRAQDESRLLQMGWRDYLVRARMTSELLVRTLRFVHERHGLERALASSREREHFHATRDHMTELPNRHHFRDELERALDRASRDASQVAVLFVDLDRFKQINDTFGHQVGDSLITTMAARLTSVLRKTDVVARVGGDEFILMLQGADLDFAPALVASKVLEVVARPFLVGEEEHSVSASVGIALYPRDGRDPDSLIRNADAAMYQAKATGRNSYQFYSQSMNAVARRRMRLEGRLRRAIDRGDLTLHFQPRVESGSWRIIGAEALARWTDAELGVVAPSEFVPIAEESGLILPIGDWVLTHACAEYRRWAEAGFGDLRFSINLSSHQIRQDRLRQEIIRALWEQDVDPGCLEVEITESTLIENQDLAASVLTELMGMGIGVSLDDFGTGFSSLSYLKRFPVDTIKIDRSFVRDILVDNDDASITEAIISIAEKLRLRVVAEGVETRGQRDFLHAHGCHEMQGYFFSPPVAGDEFLRLLREGPLER